MTKPTPAEFRAISGYYKVDDASINDMALTVGVEKTRAMCDFLETPGSSTAPAASDITVPKANQSSPTTDPQNNTGTTNKDPKS